MYNWDMLICVDCGQPFERRGTRGKLPVLCLECKKQRRRDSTNRWHKANPEKVLRHKKRKPPATELTCIDCGVVFPRDGTFGPLRTRCPECKKAYRRLRDQAIVQRRRLASYGITADQYEAMLTAQAHRCAICRSSDWGPHRPHIDHCHTLGHVRGLLCNNCNHAIGLLRDDPQLMMAAARYVMQERDDERADSERGAPLVLS